MGFMTASQTKGVHISVAAKSDVGRVRENNEDAFSIADLTRSERTASGSLRRIDVGDKGVLLVVSDGMGGEQAGEVASALVVEAFTRTLEGAPSHLAPAAQLKYAAAKAHLDVAAASRQRGREGMGATLTAVHIFGGAAFVAEIGDSRAYLLRSGRLFQLTRDQNVAQLLTDAGALEPEAAKSSPMKNVLAQAMGQGSAVQVALGKLALRDRDCILLCSDGLTGAVTDDEIRTEILGSKNLESACERLVFKANEHGGRDNITVVIAGVGGDLPSAPVGERVSTTYEILESFAPPRSMPRGGPGRIVPAAVKMTR
jgi:serine/threonine protein phosphatase PrpC